MGERVVDRLGRTRRRAGARGQELQFDKLVVGAIKELTGKKGSTGKAASETLEEAATIAGATDDTGELIQAS